jgi:Transposase IS66 family
MGKAVSHTLTQWQSLEVYLQEPEIEIDNNLVENAIRPTALGKKNWLFSVTPMLVNAARSFIRLSKVADVTISSLRQIFWAREGMNGTGCRPHGNTPLFREPIEKKNAKRERHLLAGDSIGQSFEQCGKTRRA